MSSDFDSPEPGRRSSWITRIAVLLVIVAVLASAWQYLLHRGTGSSNIGEYEARIKARGEPLTMEDLAAMYPAVPDESNGAMQLIAIWERDNPGFWRNFRQGLKLGERSNEPWDTNLPYLGSDAKHIARRASWSEQNLVAAQNLVDVRRERLQEVRAAIRQHQFHFPLKLSDGMMLLLPHLTEIRNEAQQLRIAGELSSERGEVNAAVDQLADVFLTGDTLRTEPLLISQLVRMACYTMGIGSAERLISRQKLSEQQLDRIETMIDGIQLTNSLRRALLSERVMFSDFYESGRGWLDPSAANEASEQTKVQAGMTFLSVTGLKSADRRLMFGTMEKALELADKNDADSRVEFQGLFEKCAVEAHRFPPKILSMMLLPSLKKIPDRFASIEVRCSAMRVALAVERYRLRHDDKLPGKLEDLTPEFLKKVPVDPFDGQPLRFRLLTNGYVIYSIGANRVDDGGTERPEKGSSKTFDETFTVER